MARRSLLILGTLGAVTVLTALSVVPPRSIAARAEGAAVNLHRRLDHPPWKAPSVDWPASAPADVGLDAGRIADFTAHLASKKTSAFVLVKNDRIVEEWYRPGVGVNSRLPVASAAKALVASLIVALALDEGLIHLDEPASAHIPEWRQDAARANISLLQLATHSTGIEDVYFGGGTEPDQGWQGTYYRNRVQRFQMALSVAPLLFTPGSEYRYSGVGYHALSYALGHALHVQGQPDARTLIQQRILERLEIAPNAWSVSYGEAYPVADMTLFAIGSGADFTARAAARIGQLMLDEGRWNGRQLIMPETVRQIVGPHEVPTPDRSDGAPVPLATVGWWTNADTVWSHVPADAFVGLGANHQIVLVIPSLQVVAVRFGASLGEAHWGDGFWNELEELFLDPLMRAISSS